MYSTPRRKRSISTAHPTTQQRPAAPSSARDLRAGVLHILCAERCKRRRHATGHCGERRPTTAHSGQAHGARRRAGGRRVGLCRLQFGALLAVRRHALCQLRCVVLWTQGLKSEQAASEKLTTRRCAVLCCAVLWCGVVWCAVLWPCPVLPCPALPCSAADGCVLLYAAGCCWMLLGGDER